MNFETDYIKKLAKILADNDLTEITLENGEEAIVIKRDKEVARTVTEVVPVQQSVQPAPVVQQPAASVPEAEKKTSEPKGTPVTSPMVGTFYAAPGADEEPFVKVGDTISKGQVVCIIEAMKLMNKIESEVAGKITKICVENGKPVEYGQVLMYVE
ncbi:MAG: acetyl-CoA carboxylase biotin carboxyl carrier protein [Candidatus Gastranaerophilales bacterium]|nr:acetyl-CoA carboxylase biotin carboxyl carrier protein [Candidatus Gastranaerophilales bacterium]